jgi:hypothetical protein
MLKEARDPILEFESVFAFKGFNRAYKFLLYAEGVSLSEDTDTGELNKSTCA